LTSSRTERAWARPKTQRPPLASVFRGVGVEPTLTSLAKQFLAARAAAGNSAETIKNLEVPLGQFIHVMKTTGRGGDNFRAFTPPNIEFFGSYLREVAEHKQQTVAVKISALAQFAKWLMRQQDARGKLPAPREPVRQDRTAASPSAGAEVPRHGRVDCVRDRARDAARGVSP
jgi:hypothetical protein